MLNVDTVGSLAEDRAVMFPEKEADWMQFAGLLFGATQAVKVPMLVVAPGVPKTYIVYIPDAAGMGAVAVVAGAAHDALPTNPSFCVTATLAVANAAGNCRSVN